MPHTTDEQRRYWRTSNLFLVYKTNKAEQYELLLQQEFKDLKARVTHLVGPILSGTAADRTHIFLEDRDRAFLEYSHGTSEGIPRMKKYGTLQEEMYIVAHGFILDMVINFSPSEREDFVSSIAEFFAENSPPVISEEEYMEQFRRELAAEAMVTFLEKQV